ncbi:uncharacterized protein CLAFUR5_02135 [Fulvia fulva]|uniref:Uncharacterized protein n=1 Tax=Passalora fulva TaxID=5499 RepID=A0A9Q8P2S4_PASFU|nr:uncharacterized protein CLAFUR5_02135 [Fulvia fulva]UJO10967.1 hypothetical protein CLAFUR5_02135 [Fulvia fulva]
MGTAMDTAMGVLAIALMAWLCAYCITSSQPADAQPEDIKFREVDECKRSKPVKQDRKTTSRPTQEQKYKRRDGDEEREQLRTERLHAASKVTASPELIEAEVRRARMTAEELKHDMKRRQRERELYTENKDLHARLDQQRAAYDSHVARITRGREEAQRALQREQEAYRGTEEELDLMKDELSTVTDLRVNKQVGGDSMALTEPDPAARSATAWEKRYQQARSRIWALFKERRQRAAELASTKKRVQALGEAAVRQRHDHVRLKRRCERAARDKTALCSRIRLEKTRGRDAMDQLQIEHNRALTWAEASIETLQQDVGSKQSTISKYKSRVQTLDNQRKKAAIDHAQALKRQQKAAADQLSELNNKYQQQGVELSTTNIEVARLQKQSEDKSSLIAELRRQLDEFQKQNSTSSGSTPKGGAPNDSGHSRGAKPMSDPPGGTQHAEGDELPKPQTHTTSDQRGEDMEVEPTPIPLGSDDPSEGRPDAPDTGMEDAQAPQQSATHAADVHMTDEPAPNEPISQTPDATMGDAPASDGSASHAAPNATVSNDIPPPEKASSNVRDTNMDEAPLASKKSAPAAHPPYTPEKEPPGASIEGPPVTGSIPSRAANLPQATGGPSSSGTSSSTGSLPRPTATSTNTAASPPPSGSPSPNHTNTPSADPLMVTYDQLRAVVKPEGSTFGQTLKPLSKQILVKGNERAEKARIDEVTRMLREITTNDGNMKYFLKPDQIPLRPESLEKATILQPPTPHEIRAAIGASGVAYKDLLAKFLCRMKEKKDLTDEVEKIAVDRDGWLGLKGFKSVKSRKK